MISLLRCRFSTGSSSIKSSIKSRLKRDVKQIGFQFSLKTSKSFSWSDRLRQSVPYCRAGNREGLVSKESIVLQKKNYDHYCHYTGFLEQSFTARVCQMQWVKGHFRIINTVIWRSHRETICSPASHHPTWAYWCCCHPVNASEVAPATAASLF